jgi:prophage antirepressor-like protein
MKEEELKEIQIFKNELFGEIRTLTGERGEPLFVGKDVATALGYSNTRDALRKHVDTEDKTTVAICDTGSNYKSQAVEYAFLLIILFRQAKEQFDELFIERKGVRFWVHFAVREFNNRGKVSVYDL